MILILFCSSFTSFGQEPFSPPEVEMAEKDILDLRNGALLVRLNFAKSEIEYYEKYENGKAAQKTREKSLKENTAIINAFTTYFDFCKVYFFDRRDSHAVLEKNFDQVIFYNLDAVPDTTIKLESENYYIAEFGLVEQDRSKISRALNSELDWEGKAEEDVPKDEKNALVIRDKTFEQLSDPFPYSVGYNYYGLVKYIYQLPVQRMQEMLDNYLIEVKGNR